MTGQVAVERSHYHAVCNGAVLGSPIKGGQDVPMLTSERLEYEAAQKKRTAAKA